MSSDEAGNLAIRVRDLVTHYGERQILKGIDFDVRPAEIMVIMGGSGSGKSTLMRHLLALEAATSGSVEVLGEDIGRLGTRARAELSKKIGVAFQSGALFSSLSVGENIQLPLAEHTKLNAATKAIMTRMKLEVVDLAGFEDLMPSELSGGMIKRAALARAIIMDPKILFCDEPSAGLDPVVAASLDDLILRLRDAMQMSIVVVTHELESAFKIADRITILDQGHILAVGTVDEIKNSDNERIQNILHRRTEEEILDADEYLRRLTGITVEGSPAL
ncbi:MAG: ABC transporter ATP-binding protein [Rhodospirillaceae bacterium]|jgi:phospholipid/cholesterol/gamma-HCH transport system ATP-binding protein|nr:ABC transporter ATP-binding protein [Rhodospirillaceae bacterium]MBT3884117.1 ABC transporter ATP-binding protein [Rhodospirillaceae bacterium]MBT4116922.1 ABC transporter ATP-binding protein [Rhodospirillaceae bacterium]MBT4674730.1 ABC transporter ATP-binding protein [Rhodospirillaceae bacterium]MBT4718845.1 ABC transporter ATP-binding protein [Rhodospirillaceae bacterium]